MTAALAGAVELLERSLAYTRGTLAGVRPDLLDRPTPCGDWRLGRLLAHMEDALDAFTEAATGYVAVEPVPEAGSRVGALRDKACALLGAWTVARPATVVVGDADLDSPMLVATAALEITVHGWDVGQATGDRTPIPRDLAGGLLGVAYTAVAACDRGTRFGPARPTAVDAPADVRLLAWAGRSAGPAEDQISAPVDTNRVVPAARRGLAS